VFLMSDQEDLTADLNGYYVRLGGTNDDLCLFRKEGSDETIVADGPDHMFNTSTVNARVKVTRDESGTWELFCDSTGGENFILLAKVSDNVIVTSSFFGIQCIYTATRSTKFYFDDIQVEGEEFIPPPPVKDSIQLFDIVFNELMADPTPANGLPGVEYLELYNRGERDISLKDWKLTIGSKVFTFPAIEMPANGYRIITTKEDTSEFLVYGHVTGLFTSSVTLNNTGQFLKLENSQ